MEEYASFVLCSDTREHHTFIRVMRERNARIVGVHAMRQRAPFIVDYPIRKKLWHAVWLAHTVRSTKRYRLYALDSDFDAASLPSDVFIFRSVVVRPQGMTVQKFAKQLKNIH